MAKAVMTVEVVTFWCPSCTSPLHFEENENNSTVWLDNWQPEVEAKVVCQECQEECEIPARLRKLSEMGQDVLENKRQKR